MRSFDRVWKDSEEDTPVRGADRPQTGESGRPPDVLEEALLDSFPASDPPARTAVTGIGPPPAALTTERAGARHLTSRQAKLSRETRGEHDALLVAMHRLEATLAAAAPGREQEWGARVQGDLRLVREALARHAASAESPDGLLAELDLTRPAVVRRVERLRREHADLLQQASDLLRRVERLGRVEQATEGAGERPDAADIRQQAAQLLNALRSHQAQEVDLIFETFYTDIGAGD